MIFSRFIDVGVAEWTGFLSSIDASLRAGKINLIGNRTVLYPNICFVTETPTHYLMELIGAQKSFRGLEILRHKLSSPNRYLNMFQSTTESGGINYGGGLLDFRGLNLSTQSDFDLIKTRFAVNLENSSTLLFPNAAQSFWMSKDVPYTSFGKCTLINAVEGFSRAKSINYCLIWNKKLGVDKYKEILSATLKTSPSDPVDPIPGVYVVPSAHDAAYLIHGQFSNVFLVPSLRETSLGEFIRLHPELFIVGLGYKNLLYEKSLPWLEGNPDPTEKYINPDIFLEKQGGYFDICDLKKPLNERRRITKAARKRRRFIDYVADGVAQLANYEDYFNYPKNAEFAREKYEIRVSNPLLYLVVGNYENFNPAEVEEARRMLKPNYRIIDYDTLNWLFLRNRVRKED